MGGGGGSASGGVLLQLRGASARCATGIATSLITLLFGASRITMVAARDWLLPPLLARVSPRTQTPLRAQFLVGGVAGERVGGGGVRV